MADKSLSAQIEALPRHIRWNPADNSIAQEFVLWSDLSALIVRAAASLVHPPQEVEFHEPPDGSRIMRIYRDGSWLEDSAVTRKRYSWPESGAGVSVPAATLAPIERIFVEDSDDELTADWVPEFTVWIVRRGKRFPMVIDSIFMDEERAQLRAKLLGHGEGWVAHPYSHLKPPSKVGAVHAPAEPRPQEHFCIKCHHRWTGDGLTEYCGDCHRATFAPDTKVLYLLRTLLLDCLTVTSDGALICRHCDVGIEASKNEPVPHDSGCVVGQVQAMLKPFAALAAPAETRPQDETLLEIISKKVQLIQLCANRRKHPCKSCDNQLARILKLLCECGAAETRQPPADDERAALVAMFEAFQRLKALGFKEIMYCPKDGSHFDSVEAGSTGVHETYYEGMWPDGHWWVLDGNDIWPSRPVLFRERKSK